MEQGHVAISPPDNFDFLKPERWPFWKQRFERYLRLANLSGKTDSEKIDILCYTMGIQSEEILVHEVPNPDEKSLADVLQAFTNHFCQKESVTLDRCRFNKRTRKSDESVDQFITAVHTLVESCGSGMMKKLRLEPSSTLENVAKIDHKAEMKREKDEVLPQTSASSVEPNTVAEQNLEGPEMNQTDLSSNSLEREKDEVLPQTSASSVETEVETITIAEQNSEGPEMNNTDLSSNSLQREKDEVLPQTSASSVEPNTVAEQNLEGQELNKTDLSNEGRDDMSLKPNCKAEDLNRIASDSKSVNHVKTEGNQTVSMNETIRSPPGDHQETRDFEQTAKKNKPTVQEKLRLIMNNLTSENLVSSCRQITALTPTTSQELREIVNIIYNKAIEVTSVLELWVRVCGTLFYWLPEYYNWPTDKELPLFSILMRARFRMDYEQYCSDKMKKKDIHESSPASAMEVFNGRSKSLRYFRFMGMLYTSDRCGQLCLSVRLMNQWVRLMLEENDGQSLECLYAMLSEINVIWPMSQEELNQIVNIAKNECNKFNSKLCSNFRDLFHRHKAMAWFLWKAGARDLSHGVFYQPPPIERSWWNWTPLPSTCVTEEVERLIDNLKSENFYSSVVQIKAIRMTSRELYAIAEIFQDKMIRGFDGTRFLELLVRMYKELSTDQTGLMNAINFKNDFMLATKNRFRDYIHLKIRDEELEDEATLDVLSSKHWKDRYIWGELSLPYFRLMGVLYEQGVVSSSYINDWTQLLLWYGDDRSYEYFCEMLSEISHPWPLSHEQFAIASNVPRIQDLIARGKVYRRTFLPALTMATN